MIFINELSTCGAGPDVPCRGMCSHAAGLNHSSAHGAAFPLALGMCSSAAHTERQLHAAFHPSFVHHAVRWDL